MLSVLARANEAVRLSFLDKTGQSQCIQNNHTALLPVPVYGRRLQGGVHPYLQEGGALFPGVEDAQGVSEP